MQALFNVLEFAPVLQSIFSRRFFEVFPVSPFVSIPVILGHGINLIFLDGANSGPLSLWERGRRLISRL